MTDTLGLLLCCIVHTADIQDRDGAIITIEDVLDRFPSLRHFFADGGYRGEKLADFVGAKDRSLEIVKRPEDVKGFVVLAKRWVVERTFAWLGRCRRLDKDWETSIANPSAGPTSPVSARSQDASQELENCCKNFESDSYLLCRCQLAGLLRRTRQPAFD